MAASTFVPAPHRTSASEAPHARALASTASARTAPRGEGLAPVIALPGRGPASAPVGASAAGGDVARPGQVTLRVVPALSTVRTRRQVWAAVAAALVLVFAASGLASASGTGELAVAGHVVLQPGETLWDVAVRSAPAGVDPRRQLDDIRRINGFGPGAHDAWTVVLIPAR